MSRHVVARVGEIAPGQSKMLTIEKRELGIYFVNGEYFALANRCPHQGGPLCRGRLVSLVEADQPGEFRVSRRGEILRCPWHGWEFDIRNGQSWCDPTRVSTRTYAVTVEPGASLIKGPYVADTFPVRVEDDYVIVEL